MTDGTVVGTRQVVDLNPGVESGVTEYVVPHPFREGIVFAGDGGPSVGKELFYSDGTIAGTRLIADLWPGAGTQSQPTWPRLLGTWNDELYFEGQTPATDFALFKVSTALSGVQFIADIPSTLSGPSIGGSAAPSPNGLVFAVFTDGQGSELWRSAGTSGTTNLIADLNPDPINGSSFPQNLTRMGNAVYFTADDGVHGRELWKSDGTPIGTTILIDLFPGDTASDPADLVVVGDQLYFTAYIPSVGRELLRTDGTMAGTELVVNLGGTQGSNPTALTRVGERLFFSAWDGLSVGRELFVTDGTSMGTRLVADLSTASVSLPTTSAAPYYLTELEGRLIFFHDSVGGLEPWVSDGTAMGTNLVSDIQPGAAGCVEPPSSASSLERVVLGRRLYFPAFQGATGGELWSTDGTPQGTSLVADLSPGIVGSFPKQLGVVGDALMFLAETISTGKEIWRTLGTSATTSVLDIVPGLASSNPLQLTSVGPYAFFGRQLNGQKLLFRTDGISVTPVATVGDLTNSFLGGSFTDPMVRLGSEGVVLFSHFQSLRGTEWWVSDGTSVGTTLLTDSAPDSLSSDPEPGVQLGDRYVYAALDPFLGVELHSIELRETPAWVAEPIGRGCMGVRGEFMIVRVGEARLGSTFGIDLSNSPRSTPIVLFASSTMVGPQAAGACDLRLTQPIVIGSVLASPTGGAAVVAPVPSVPSLVGSLFYLQGAAPLLNGPFQGVATWTAPFEVFLNL